MKIRNDEAVTARCYKWNPVTMDFDDVYQNEGNP